LPWPARRKELYWRQVLATDDDFGHIRSGTDIRRSYARPDEFFRELNALHRLGDIGLRVPKIVDVDFENLSLWTSPVDGRSFEGTDMVEFAELLGRDLQTIHRAGLLMGDINSHMFIIADDGLPVWVDFSGCEDFSELSWQTFRYLADRDTEKFNGVFSTSFATFDSLSEEVRSMIEAEVESWYSTAYLGAGLRVGRLWNLSVGWGRWEFLLGRSLPAPGGKRILDLGANNGHNGLEMLRAGAVSVVGLEQNQDRIAQGILLKQAYEWADGTTYDYLGIHGDMRDLPTMGLGQFDMITALCSMYYLTEPEIVELVTSMRSMTPVLVLECNETKNIGRRDQDTYRKASMAFNISILKANGFPDVEVVAPKGYDRPLVIGRQHHHASVPPYSESLVTRLSVSSN
jgi:tRNA A-37 threonylcarbamoyl transferase component Bud32